MNKELYINMMDRVFDAYTEEHIKSYIASVKENLISEHGFPRLTANLGILIAHGKKLQYKELFVEMMDLCCEQIPYARDINGYNTGNDFSVKEIVSCILEIEKAGIFDKNITDEWRKQLAEIDVYKTYTVIVPVPPVPTMNWAAFGAASEQLRKYAGIGCDEAFMENQIKSQMFNFDENGMYKDPGNPMVYDFIPRLQLAIALHFGYNGESYDAIVEELTKSADLTLRMQSVTGEIPYGGRSHQFLHNETMYASLCEFYATFFKNQGDMEKAGQFKRAAHLAFDEVCRWLKKDKLTHIKNAYPFDSMYGCEFYAYFDKYMITAASWLYTAYAMADDSIEETCAPAESENYICILSTHFHKTFIKFNDWFAEFDTDADNKYDGNGLGRIHKKGMPSALCLSTPFTATPDYQLDIKNPSHFSICGGIKTDSGHIYGHEEEVEYRLICKEVADDFAAVSFECKKGTASFIQSLKLFDEYAEIAVEGNSEVELLFPVFDTDGEIKTKVFADESSVSVSYRGCKCTYTAETGRIIDLETVYANRNGHYRAFALGGENKVVLKITMGDDN